MHEQAPVTKTFLTFEQEHIMPIPENKRTGTNKTIFAIWLSLNMMPLAVVTGAVATGGLGLPLGWSFIAVITGNLIGAFGAALHASQGPTLGIPQMLQARAQFGYLGASVFALIAYIMFIGFFASILLVAKDSLAEVFPGFDGTTAIIVFALIGIVLCVFGYDLLRKTMVWLSVLIGVAVAISMVLLAFQPAALTARSDAEMTLEGFFAMLSIGIVWQLAYAPYVSDYSRYLPKDTGPKTAFWSTYFGLVLSSVFVMGLGVLLGAIAPDNPLGALGKALGPLGIAVLLIFAVTSALINGVELYSAVMNGLTVLQSNFRTRITTGVRVWTTVVSGGIATLIAVLGQGDFMTMFLGFLDLLLYVLIPWSAINLVDFFIVQKGHYEVGEMFDPNGKYGKWNSIGLASYGIGLLTQLPFMNIAIFKGPLAGTINISWLVGFVVTAAVFLALTKLRKTRR